MNYRNQGKRLLLLLSVMAVMLSASGQDTLSVAADFPMETREGQTVRLSALTAPGRTPTAGGSAAADGKAGATGALTLLMFYDPDCTDCRQELFLMRHSSSLRRAVSEGRLRVVLVYAEQDETLWRATSGELPAAWTVAWARTDVHALYDLSAMPLLLLLDSGRRVVRQGYEYRDLSID